ncbi:MAG: methyltransferase domain-containing protein [Candidatus Lokiarchaeota archaeon]|nr:methyltransferase domain-containing protein [Candidatus Lokiarchaeota archaeon]MBD3200099.1 methyltransferase domain-containing protein [Candidatus Lokiarchaeota archaeon]
MNEEIIKENDFIFLILDERRRWLTQAISGKTFHTHLGLIDFDDVIGKPFGTSVFSKPYDEQGYKFYVLKPYPSDFVRYMGRKTQIIYPKDAGLILMYSNIRPGSRIVEAGCGSGALTCILGTYVSPNGHVYSYDVREKSLKQATKNIQSAKLDDIVSISYGDIINDDISHENIDVVVLDMPTPWAAIKKVNKYLKLSGSVVSFSPTIEQAKKSTFSLQENGFLEINTFELLLRKMQIKKNATRPETRMVGHSGYITFGRKFLDKKNPYRGRIPEEPEYVSFEGMPLRGNKDEN